MCDNDSVRKEFNMNLAEFKETYKAFGSHSKIDIKCNECEKVVLKTKKDAAKRNIIKNGVYICRSCSMKKNHVENPRDDSTKEKQRIGRLGKKHSNESKKKMSEARKAFFKTKAGEEHKKQLSKLAAQGHAENKYAKSIRSGWHKSPKAGEVFYGSSYELLFCYQLDNDDLVKTYETQVSYEIDGRGRCLDFLVTDFNDHKTAHEVKPDSRKNEKNNVAQIEDSMRNAIRNGWNFSVISECELGMSEREIMNWTDQFITERGYIDLVGIRKDRNKEKAKKHYHKKIATDKVEVFCDYCQETHTPLRKTYEKNVARNGKYICERLGGHLAGSKPKKKKVNPYASVGNKQCNECKEVLLFEMFGKDKMKSDGLATRCKTCRADKAKKRYNDAKQQTK